MKIKLSKIQWEKMGKKAGWKKDEHMTQEEVSSALDHIHHASQDLSSVKEGILGKKRMKVDGQFEYEYAANEVVEIKSINQALVEIYSRLTRIYNPKK